MTESFESLPGLAGSLPSSCGVLNVSSSHCSHYMQSANSDTVKEIKTIWANGCKPIEGTETVVEQNGSKILVLMKEKK